MFDAASGATDSVPGCGRAPGDPSSSAAARRNGAASLPRPYRSLRRSTDVRSVRRSGVRRRVGGVTVVVAPGVPGAARVAFLAGRDVGVMFQTTRDGLRVATYLVPIPAVASRDGAPVAVVDIGALISPWHDDVVTRIIGSLPGDREAPDVGGGS